MPVCIVEGCATTSKRKTDDIMLHSFPKDKELIKRWLQQMHQELGDVEEFAEKVFTSTRGNYRMCSLHFTRSAYEIRGLTTFLRRDAIPTLFPEPVIIQLPAKGFSSAILNSELHTVHARPTTNVQQPIRQIVVGLCQHGPSVAPQIRIKTEDETSYGAFESSDMDCHCSPALSPQPRIKTEDETSSREILTNERHVPQTMAPTNVLTSPQRKEVGCQHKRAMARQIHIKTEDETSSGFITTELHTEHTMPPNNGQQELVAGHGQQVPAMSSQIKTFTVLTLDQHSNLISTPQITGTGSQGFIPVVSRKRPYTPKNIKTIGTMTDYMPAKVHKSIQFDKSMGTNNKSFQVSLRPFHSSVGIQCNLVNLPSLKTLSTHQ